MKRKCLRSTVAVIILVLLVSLISPLPAFAKDLVVYSQRDSRWSSHLYTSTGDSSQTIGSSGCGILAYVNAIHYLNGSFIDPIMLADWSVAHGHRTSNSGTAYSLYPSFAKSYGSTYGFGYQAQVSSYSSMISSLQNGCVAVGSAPGHLMAIVDYDSSTGKFLILDSAASSARHTASTGYTWETEASCRATAKLQFSNFFIFYSTVPEEIPSLSVSSGNITLNKSNNESRTVTVEYSGYDDEVSMRYVHGPDQITNCTWGSWSGNSIPLTISGYANGTEKIRIELIDSEAETIITSVMISVTVKSDPLSFTASTNSVQITGNTSKDISFSYKNYDGPITIVVEHPNHAMVGTKWKGWVGQTNTLTITGYDDGSETMVVYIKDTKTDVFLAQQNIKVTVNGFSTTVTFDSNDGSKDPFMTYTFKKGKTYDLLPLPTRSGYDFDGWYTAASGGREITSTTPVETASPQTFYAHWTPRQYTLLFDANGGTCSQTSKTITYGETLGTLPIPTRDGYAFTGWYDPGIKRVIREHDSYYHSEHASYTLTATWSSMTEKSDLHIVVEEVEIPENRAQELDHKIPVHVSLEKPVDLTSIEFGIKVDSRCTTELERSSTMDRLVENDHAVWLYYASGSPETTTDLVTLYVTVPSDARPGDVFKIEYMYHTLDDTRSQIWCDLLHKKNYAPTWQNGYIKILPSEYKVDLDANGGTTPTTSKTVVNGSTYGPLPTPTREGYDLVGWFTSLDGGTQIKEDTVVDLTGEQTLYAHWIKSNLRGDVSVNGVLNVTDLIIMQKYLHAMEPFTELQFAIADMNGDGNVNVFDLALLKRQLLSK